MQNSNIQSQFSTSKIIRIFLKKCSLMNINLEGNFFSLTFFDNFKPKGRPCKMCESVRRKYLSYIRTLWDITRSKSKSWLLEVFTLIVRISGAVFEIYKYWVCLLAWTYLINFRYISIKDHTIITSSKRWVGNWQSLMIYSIVNYQRGGWVGLKKSKTWWCNTWMVP